jgi:hypothetical protein
MPQVKIWRIVSPKAYHYEKEAAKQNAFPRIRLSSAKKTLV